MQKSTWHLYKREIRRQCEYALGAAKDYQDCFAAYPWDLDTTNGEGHPEGEWNKAAIEELSAFERNIYRHAHSFLSHTSNVSRLFWPVANSKANESQEHLEARVPRIKRGRLLREKYDLPSLSILSNRRLRDHFEHFDERLDALVVRLEASGGNLTLMDQGIGPSVAEPDETGELDALRKAGVMIRFAFPEMFIFLNEDYDLLPIIDTLKLVLDRTNELNP